MSSTPRPMTKQRKRAPARSPTSIWNRKFSRYGMHWRGSTPRAKRRRQMTRVLSFEGERGARRFDLLRTALLAGGDGKGDRTPQVIRKEARLMDLLDTVSDPTGP